jgi:hypothetical protein
MAIGHPTAATAPTAEPQILDRVGVVPYEPPTDIDATLAAAVAQMRARGVIPSGLLQRLGNPATDGRCSMWIEDIATGAVIRLDSPRGPGATACLLDPDALARAGFLLQRAIETGADLLVVNRFGKAEAEGGGLRAEMAEAICAGAAVLVAVRSSLLADLEAFLGMAPNLLLPSPGAIADWAVASIGGRRRAVLG